MLGKLGLKPTGGNFRYIAARIRHVAVDTSHFRYGKGSTRFAKLTRDELEPLVARSTSYAQVLVLLDLPESGRPQRELSARLRELSIDTTHFRGSGWARGETRASHPAVELATRKRMRPDDDVFVANAAPLNGRNIVMRMLARGVQYLCASCGISEWQGKRLVLHIDHINGINNDNRFENLRLLCPNCHSQTDTYGRRASRACERPHVLYDVRSRAWRNWYPR